MKGKIDFISISFIIIFFFSLVGIDKCLSKRCFRYEDKDGDGYGVPINNRIRSPRRCEIDCDDNDPDINPGKIELCDGKDNDCDGQIDDNLGTTTCGAGECERTVDNCREGRPQECIPGEPSEEICDGKDNDCDGQIDEVCEEWKELEDTPQAGGYGEVVVAADHFIYVGRCLNESSMPTFWRYDTRTKERGWEEKNAPEVPFKNGTACVWDRGDYIYCLMGGAYKDQNRKFFYRYHIKKDRWESITDTPKAQGAGDAITFVSYKDQRCIYAFIGNGSNKTIFAKYCPEEGNEWIKLCPGIPNTDNNDDCLFRTDDGSSLVWTGTNYLYGMTGEIEEECSDNECDKNRDFWRYNIDKDEWTEMSDVPCQKGVGDGGSLVWGGSCSNNQEDFIYLICGGTYNEHPGYKFYRYYEECKSDNCWEQLLDLPCPVGYYVGARCDCAWGHLYYWQGSPTTYSCGGKAFYRYKFPALMDIK